MQEKRKIPFKDLHNLSIPSLASEIRIGNILLSNYLSIDESYDIQIINKEKNIDNKWLDSAVTMTKVMDTLIEFNYDKKMLELAEVPLNKELEKFFKEHFESVKKSDTSNKGLIDLTIGNEKSKIAIELKLSRKIKLANESQKCRGQIEDYKKQFGSNLILVIAGDKSDKQEKYLQECIKKADSLGIKNFYIQAK
jgi:Holliday junction resolvase